ncbi:hypothetical protein ACPCSP_25400 [Streptomyces cinereoruber]|uniref:hypothetical protein n=1 Tax=Streptomyces cinereoruber TaxID=67260 RepID=UPI003C2CB04E
MTSDKIHVQPAVQHRQAFARWAVSQNPKLRTVGPSTFAVPEDLFTGMPEDILIGALVDGQRYVSPEEDAAEGRPAPGSTALVGEAGPETVVPLPAPGGELLGVATVEGFTEGERKATPDEPLPELQEQTDAPDTTGPETAGEDAGDEDSDSSDSASDITDGPFVCSSCEKEFSTERGREAHQRIKHPDA